MPMPTRWWDEDGEAVEQLEWAKDEHAAAIDARLGQLVEELLAVAVPGQALACERGSGAVAQQPFEAGAVAGLDAHARIDRESRVVCPAGHVLCRLAREQCAALEQAQDALCHHTLERCDVGGIEGACLVKAQCAVAFAEHAVDDGAMVIGECQASCRL